jgi:hypothetical protein
MRRLSLLCAAAGWLAACDRTPPAPKPAETAPKWRLEDAGLIAGPAPRQRFFKVRGVALHPDGRFAVVDKGNKLVTLFDTLGRPRGSVGMEGRGAGQYQEPYSAAWLGDTLAVFDHLGGRVVYFTNGITPNGESITIPMSGDETVRWYPVSASRAYLRSVRLAGTKFTPVLVGFQGRGPRDTLVIPDPPPIANGASCKTEGGGLTYFQWPEAPTQFAIPIREDGSLAVAITSEYRVLLRSPKNDTIATLRAKTAPVGILQGEWDAGLKEYYRFLERHGEAVCDAKPVRPPHRAPLRAITLSLDGDIWVTVLDGPTLRFDVYGADGKIKATMPAPPHNIATPVVIAGSRVLVVAPGVGGGDVVHLYRIVR